MKAFSFDQLKGWALELESSLLAQTRRCNFTLGGVLLPMVTTKIANMIPAEGPLLDVSVTW